MHKLTQAKNVINLSAPIELKKVEIRFAASVAMHSPIMSSDHFGEIMASNFCTNSAYENKLKNLSVHRTKSTGLIKNVIDYYAFYNTKFTFTKVISRALKKN